MPGDHIALGTPPGVGHAKKPDPRWLKPGEVVDIEIEGIGICSNPIVDEADLAKRADLPLCQSEAPTARAFESRFSRHQTDQ